MTSPPEETVVAFWDALYARDWDRIASFFDDASIYYDVPVGPGAAGKGPASILARLQLGLDGLAGYDHHPDRRITTSPDGWVMTEHTEVWTWDGGATVALPFVSVQRVVDGTITRWRDYWDQQTLMAAAPPAWHDRLATADLSWVHDATDEF